MNDAEEPAEAAFNKIRHQWEDRKQYTKNEAQFVEEGFYMGWQACTEFIAEGGRRRWMVTEQEIRVAFDKYDMEPWTPEDKAILRNDRAGTEENFLMFKAGAVFGRNAGLEEAADVVGKRTGFLSTTVNSCEAMRLIRALKTAEVDNG